MKNPIHVIHLTEEGARVVEVLPELEPLQRLVGGYLESTLQQIAGGYLESITLAPHLHLIVNEEGALIDPPLRLCWIVNGTRVRGRCFLTRSDDDGDFVGFDFRVAVAIAEGLSRLATEQGISVPIVDIRASWIDSLYTRPPYFTRNSAMQKVTETEARATLEWDDGADNTERGWWYETTLVDTSTGKTENVADLIVGPYDDHADNDELIAALRAHSVIVKCRFEVGDHVCAGETDDDYDVGRVAAHGIDRATNKAMIYVAWSGGTFTWEHSGRSAGLRRSTQTVANYIQNGRPSDDDDEEINEPDTKDRYHGPDIL